MHGKVPAVRAQLPGVRQIPRRDRPNRKGSAPQHNAWIAAGFYLEASAFGGAVVW
jgi:hypothetical protein